MKSSNRTRTRRRDNMDGQTAMAFAADRFEKLHSRDTCPDWLPKCTSIGYHWDDNDNYIVTFSVTPKATNTGVRYFEVSVNPTTAETVVLLDTGPPAFQGEDLQGY